MENLTGGTPPVRYLPCVVPCKLYFTLYEKEDYINTTRNNFCPFFCYCSFYG